MSLSWSRDFASFMEREASLPCPQQHVTGFCPEPDEPSAHHDTLFKRHLNINPPYTPIILSCLFRSGFPFKISYAFLITPMRATCPTNPALLALIIFGEEYTLQNLH